jgi:hypothetical protein
VDDEKLNFLKLFADRAEMGIERKWANSIDPNEAMTPEKAQQIVATVLREQLIDKPLKSKDPGAKVLHGLLAIDEVFHTLQPSESEIDLVIARAGEDYTAFQALRMLVVLGFPQHFVALRKWDMALKTDLLTEPPAPKGPSIFRDAQRNMVVISQIQQLELLKFNPTRGEKKNKAFNSGCDIVSRAMADVGRALGYGAVESIWKKRDKLPAPQTLASMIVQALVGAPESRDEKPSGK